VKKALEGLKGVSKVEVDLAHDLFRVTLAEKDGPTQEALFAVVKDLAFTPSAAPAESFRVAATPLSSTGEAPEAVRKALGRAKAEKKLVLVDLMGDH
jgi:copper chaperone CopZ